MKQTIIIHGAPYEDRFYSLETSTPSNGVWIPWVQKQLSVKDVLVQAPEFPKPYDPVYEDWSKILDQMIINKEVIMVAHSCGAGFLLRYFSEKKEIIPKKIFLVAPWIDTQKELTTDFFNFEIDPSITDRIQIDLIMSDDDHYQIPSVEIIMKALPKINYHRFIDRGHFTEKEFPELVELILK